MSSVAAFDIGIINFAVCVASQCDDTVDDAKDTGLPLHFKVESLTKFSVGSCTKGKKTTDDMLVVNLFAWLDEHRAMFDNVGTVAIELQKKVTYGKFKPPNISMVLLSHALQCWFISNMPNAKVVFQSPSSNNHVLPKTKKRKRADGNGDGAYAVNKKDAVTMARHILSSDSAFFPLLHEQKSDDFADALLHAIYRLQHVK